MKLLNFSHYAQKNGDIKAIPPGLFNFEIQSLLLKNLNTD